MQVTALRTPVQIGPVLRQHSLLIGIVLTYVAVSALVVARNGVHTDSEMASALWWNFVSMLPAMAYFLLIGRFLHVRFTLKPDNQFQWFANDVRATVTNPHRLVSGGLCAVLMVTVLLSFAQLKRLIPVLHPFAWDQTFMQLDRTLHFGHQPYEIANAILGHPIFLTIFTGAYNFWLFLMYFVLLATCFTTRNPRLKLQYLIAFIMTWAIGGNLIATVFSSAGPVYFARLGLGDVFAPLMDVLHAHAASSPITVIETQNLLWDYYTAPQSMNGISAMPSMHVASSVLMACYAFRFGRWAGIAFSVFAGTIMVGSVLLAWHYAVDGYVGAIIALACWKLSGWLVAMDRWDIPTSARA